MKLLRMIIILAASLHIASQNGAQGMDYLFISIFALAFNYYLILRDKRTKWGNK